MGSGTDRSSGDGAGARSLVSDLVAWLLIGVPIGQLGVTAREALAGSLPISRWAALVVVVAVAVGGALLARDFRPTVLGAVVFYVVYALLQVYLVVTAHALFVPDAVLSPAQRFGLDGIAVAVALAAVFTETSRRARRRIRDWAGPRVRKLLKQPPRDGSGNGREGR